MTPSDQHSREQNSPAQGHRTDPGSSSLIPHPSSLACPAPLFAPPGGAAAFAASLKTRALGRRLEYHLSTASTNDLAVQAARAGVPHGLCVVAEEQSAGRGRRGRAWLAPPGTALLFSVVLRPEGAMTDSAGRGVYPLPLRERVARDSATGEGATQPARLLPRMGWLSLAVSFAVRDALVHASGVAARVKWPNDIVVAAAPSARGAAPWRKLGGVLVQCVAVPDGAEAVVAGIGLNVLQDAAALPQGLKTPATSLRVETSRDVPRREVLSAILMHLEGRWDEFCCAGEFALLREELEVRMDAWWRGWTFTVQTPDGPLTGRFAGLDDLARLRLEAPGGKQVLLADAEVLTGEPSGEPIDR